eukprot:CAMPEP_0172153630 /NCGR_PEP_ID=MMETSP1050-20130122/1561_1 /TAXON_ID=233186 /ORGANISM="Cryptomonas curvata, Strain CCAP979/52" /LENGTH=106 /DNA_ID=CAMNT_0012822207 /DNA_START=195 /DNA_END=512 /DNA_ORIENTATION=+
MTNALLPSKVLIPCHPIKALIQGFLQQHPQVAEECRRISCSVSQYSINTTPFVPEAPATPTPSLRRIASMGRSSSAGSDAASAALFSRSSRRLVIPPPQPPLLPLS